MQFSSAHVMSTMSHVGYQPTESMPRRQTEKCDLLANRVDNNSEISIWKFAKIEIRFAETNEKGLLAFFIGLLIQDELIASGFKGGESKNIY